MPEIVLLIGSILGGLAGVAALVKVFIDARNVRPNIAEAYEQMATRQAKQIDGLRKRVSALEEDLKEQERYIDELLRGIKVLVGQLCMARIDPDYTPSRLAKRSEQVETEQDEVE